MCRCGPPSGKVGIPKRKLTPVAELRHPATEAYLKVVAKEREKKVHATAHCAELTPRMTTC